MFNDFATWPCKKCACVDEDVCMIGMKGKRKKNSLKCYSVSWKSCEKSTKCPHRFVFKSWFVMCSLAIFYFKVLPNVCLPQTPTWSPCIHSFKQLLHEAMPQLVITWCIWRAGLQYRATCLVCWLKAVFLTCNHVSSLKQRIQKGHLYIL